MSANKLHNVGFDFTQLNKVSSKAAKTGETGASNAKDAFALELAQLQTDQFGALLNTAFGTKTPAVQSSQAINSLTGTSPVNAASAIGRNTALRDPDAAYNMMSQINNFEANFKAQFAQLSHMRSGVTNMQQAGQSLAGISATTSNDNIKAQLQTFTNQYNGWVKQFDEDVKEGGVLANTQAAQVARFELRQHVESVFHGAKDGLRGLHDLGLTTDPNTKLVTLDPAKLDQVLASNRTGVLSTIKEFSGDFVKAATLLNSPGNFITNQLGNLGRAIAYINDNKTSLQAEFGTGDEAKPTVQVAKALASYNQTYKT